MDLETKEDTYDSIMDLLELRCIYDNDKDSEDPYYVAECIENDALTFTECPIEMQSIFDNISDIVDTIDSEKNLSFFYGMAIKDYRRAYGSENHLKGSKKATQIATPIEDNIAESVPDKIAAQAAVDFKIDADVKEFVLNNHVTTQEVAAINNITSGVIMGDDDDIAMDLAYQFLDNGLIEAVRPANHSNKKKLETLNPNIEYNPVHDSRGSGWLVFTNNKN